MMVYIHVYAMLWFQPPTSFGDGWHEGKKMYIIYGKIVNSFITVSIKLAPLQVSFTSGRFLNFVKSCMF